MKANQAISSLFIAVVFVSCASPGKAQADEGILEQLDLVDYSYAGYDFGESELPTEYDLPVFNVEDFGAVANDDISDQEAIEKAIDRAEMKGGVVLFGAGKYIVNDTKGNKNGILIKSSNVILKGTGSGENGTIIHMKEALDPKDPKKLWTTPPMLVFKGKGATRTIDAPLVKDVKQGDKSILFGGTHGLKKGDLLFIKAQGTFLNDRLLAGKKTRDLWTTINEKGAAVHEIHEVAGVSGKKVTFRAPVLIDMNRKEPWKFVKVDFITHCGFEDIRFEGNFYEPFVHHKNAYHDGGFTAINMAKTHNSWVRNCVFANVNVAVSFSNSLTGTMLNSRVVGNGGHSSFVASRSSRTLIAYCRDDANQWHGPDSSHEAVGTVILRFEGINRGIDAHGNVPRFTLWDQCVMAGFDGDSVGRTSHGANYTNLPNHSVGLVFWNFTQTARPRPGFDFWDLMEDTPGDRYGPLTAVNPVIVGFQGEGTSFMNAGVVKSFGQAVEPSSLYLYQLRGRLGTIPAYLAEKTTSIK